MIKKLFDSASPNILIFDILASSSDEAKTLIQNGVAEHGLIIWAKDQTEGRGRYHRKWASETGNLTFSFVINNQLRISKISLYPFLAALAIRDALFYLTGLDIYRFKWPNDLLIDGKKFAGILFESEITQNPPYASAQSNFGKLICGIGINIKSFPKELMNATCLEQEGIRNLEPLEVIFSIMKEFDKYLEMAAIGDEMAIYSSWEKYAYNLGQEIKIISSGRKFSGKFIGIKEGALMIEDQGNIHSFITGEVFFDEEKEITIIDEGADLENITFLHNHFKKDDR